MGHVLQCLTSETVTFFRYISFMCCYEEPIVRAIFTLRATPRPHTRWHLPICGAAHELISNTITIDLTR